MCGIAGMIVPPGEELRSMEPRLLRMQQVQRHRGPDDRGVWWHEDTRVGLAANRLAIRDRSPAGHMPMQAGPLCITYNGEIYNAQELRAELETSGAQFFSHSDTEVILRGYLHWGIDVLQRLRGMFAFALHDAGAEELLLARDPFGIKPLYYTARAPFCFASEVRALAASDLIDRTIDARALSAYLQLGSVPAPLTVYQDVRSLLPGHYARVALRTPLPVQARPYWSWPAAGSAQSTDLAAALEQAVRSHLAADVPIGAFLSGGLDSSAIVALAQARLPEPMSTCSIAFASPQHDESVYARSVAAALGTAHHERVVTRADFFPELDAFTAAQDQPSIDGFNTYFVAQTAAQLGLKVALSGLGGDELFGGYPTFTGVPRVLRMVKSVRALAGSHAQHAIAAFAPSDRWRKVAAATARPSSPASAFLVYRGLFTPGETARLLPAAPPFDAVQHVHTGAGPASGNLSAWISKAELRTYTSNQLLRDTDVMSMRHSIEVRVPLLDTALVETVFGLPASEREAARGKRVLRALLANRLPALVLERKERQGFAFPMREWLPDAPEHLWNWDSPLFDQFDREALQEVQQRFISGRAHWSRVWSLMALNAWARATAND